MLIQYKGHDRPAGPRLAVMTSFYSEDISGGRYHIFSHAAILADVFPTTLVVSSELTHYIPSILNPKLDVIVDPNFCLDSEKNEFDFILTMQLDCGIAAFKYAKKWRLPIYMMVVETPNFTIRFRDLPCSYEPFWKGYKKCLMEADFIIASTPLTAKNAHEWLGNPKGKIVSIPMGLNYDGVKAVKDRPEEHAIIWISRPVSFKRPQDALLIAKELDRTLTVRYITRESELIKNIQREATKCGIKVEIYDKISEQEKFEKIKSSKFLVHPNSMADFSMPIGEALLCGKPCLSYGLPIQREVWQDKADWAELGDIDGFLEKAGRLLSDDEYRKRRGAEGKKFMENHPCNPKNVREEFLKIMPPRGV